MDPGRALQLSIDYQGVDPVLLADILGMGKIVQAAMERVDPARSLDVMIFPRRFETGHTVFMVTWLEGHMMLHVFPERGRAHLDLLLFRGDPHPAAHQVTSRLATMSPRMSSATRLTNRRSE